MAERFIRHIIVFCLLLVRILNKLLSVPKRELCFVCVRGVDGEFTPLGQARDKLRKTRCLVSGHRSFVFHFVTVFTWSVHQRFCAVSFFFPSWVILCDVIEWQRGLLSISLAFVYCWFVFLTTVSLCPKSNCVYLCQGAYLGNLPSLDKHVFKGLIAQHTPSSIRQ